jgi:hypothetical protein
MQTQLIEHKPELHSTSLVQLQIVILSICLKADMPQLHLRPLACRAVVNGRMFVVGGLGASGTALNTIEVFQPTTKSWTTFAQLPSARSDVGCAASGNNLIVAGGPPPFAPVHMCRQDLLKIL